MNIENKHIIILILIVLVLFFLQIVCSTENLFNINRSKYPKKNQKH
jgi:hypothetical protein